MLLINYQRLLTTIHPLLFITISLILGISWGNITGNWSVPIQFYYIIIFLIITCISMLYISKKQPHILNILIPLLFFFIGIVVLQNQYNQHNYLNNLLINNNLKIKGKVYDIIYEKNLRLPCKITFTIQAIKKDSNWETIQAPIYIYTQNNHSLEIDDIVTIKNINCAKIFNKSFEQYLIKEGITNTFFCNKLSITSIKKPVIAINKYIKTIKKSLFTSLQNKLSTKTNTLFTSLFLGNKTEHKEELEQVADTFKIWGISHYLARSGLHLIIFIATWEVLFRFIPIHFAIKQFILLLISLIYFLLSWTSLSFMRALYTFILYKIGVLTKKQTNFLHLLIIVSFITLIQNPIQLLFLDFQLSFGLTFALIYFNYNYTKSSN